MSAPQSNKRHASSAHDNEPVKKKGLGSGVTFTGEFSFLLP
ncbi:hypothetical protein FOXG_19618 [Fusarium oxysporum f. sp. lycopersici 4287]|uniref:Uncharacterized protein n=1 Tax=Fusarium oxysporum f. sp. lycopersici (strain 4287 / CBS 123668 / FGSC 9935 / NRRL 34936) TaxID=426428 RepID=A0A0J9V611_FUSO4|nr:hypothetical protein FOXG_19618 [Fusarium oxysporum f. sp. lycopersici 4287]KNB06271.1 hypothetical protein FOXG_19618 [Fusarium oxysporum f. sp. lycopersici 4287]